MFPQREKETHMRKTLVRNAATFATLIVCLAGCGKKTETATLGKNVTNYPLPDPPLVADCAPGIRGGRLVIAEPGDPQTFNPITANESSSQDIYRFFFA